MQFNALHHTKSEGLYGDLTATALSIVNNIYTLTSSLITASPIIDVNSELSKDYFTSFNYEMYLLPNITSQ